MAGNVNFEVLRGAGNFAYANGYVEEGARLLSRALSYEEDARTRLYAGIAYYKAAKLKGKKSYYERAISFLKGALDDVETAEEARYFLSLAYSAVGNLYEAQQQFKKLERTSLLEQRAIISSLDSIMYVKAKEAEELKESYAVLDDPLLVEVFNIVYPYIRGTDIEESLAKKHGVNGSKGFAIELKEAFEEEFNRKEGNPFLKLARTVVRALKGKNPRYLELLSDEESWGEGALSRFPVLTRNILIELLQKFGRKKDESLKLPHTIKKRLLELEKVARTYSKLESMNKDELIKSLKGLRKVSRIEKALEDLEAGLPINRRELKRMLWKELKKGIGRLLKMVKLFFYEGKEKQILKLLIAGLPVSNEEKVDLFLEIG